MHPDQLFANLDPYAGEIALDNELLEQIIKASPERPSDIDALDGVIRLLRSEIEQHSSRGWATISDSDLDLLNRTYRTLCARLGVEGPRLPFRDWTEYQRWRRRENWEFYEQIESAHKELAYWDEFFCELETHVLDMLEASWTYDLLRAISPHQNTGWDAVDDEIRQLRERFAAARSAADHSAVGHQCVRVIEKLAIAAYDDDIHGRFSEGTTSPSDTKNRFEAIISAHASGRDNAAIRKLSKDIVVLTQEVKHRHTPDRADAGVAADSVVYLANVIRRLIERPIRQ